MFVTGPNSKHEDFVAIATDRGYGNENLSECFMAFGVFSRQEPRRWLGIMPQVVCIHGEFHDIDEKGEVPGVPYDQLCPSLLRAGTTASCRASGRDTSSQTIPDCP